MPMRLGYLYSRYPVISQTFCDAEMLALERRGLDLEIGSINPPLTSFRHADTTNFRAEICRVCVAKACQRRIDGADLQIEATPLQRQHFGVAKCLRNYRDRKSV